MENEEEENKIVDNAWSIDIPKFTREDNPRGLTEESKFATLFPKYREGYLKDCWPLVVKTLGDHGLKAEMDLLEGSLTVRTTRKTWDPFIIIKGRDMLKLLARSVPYEHALKVLEDSIGSDVIKIGSSCGGKRERFVKRRQRLIGPDGVTLKSIELLTSCYVLVQGNTVSVVGPYQGLKQVRRIVLDTMSNNVHPVYNIKTLMIKRELMKDPVLKNENWERFLPKFENKNISKRKKSKNQNSKEPKGKKVYTPFPPPMPESKLDKELASGEYFLKPKEKKLKKILELKERQAMASVKRDSKRQKPFIAPKEKTTSASTSTSDSSSLLKDIKSIKRKAKNIKKYNTNNNKPK